MFLRIISPRVLWGRIKNEIQVMKKINKKIKALRDEWLAHMVKFRKLGDDKTANLCLENAVKVWNLRMDVEVKN